MRSTICTVLLSAAATAQSATVTNLADSGAGSLRAALQAANASGAASFTIDVTAGGTAGAIVLSSVLPTLTHANVTIRPLAGGRLIIDAQAITATGGTTLTLAGNGIQLLVPCRILVRQGHAILVQGSGVRVQDLEAIGNRGGFGIGALPGADDLAVGRLYVDTFQQGLLLQSCQRVRAADDGVSVVDCRNCAGPGIWISGGSDHQIGAFSCTACALGVSAANSPGLRLGRAGNPRSLVSGNQQQGMLLTQCSGLSLANADVLGNGLAGGHGVQVIGGAGLAATDLRLEGNSFGGLVVEGGASLANIGPGVTTRGAGGSQDIGFTVRDASRVTVTGCTFGPLHRLGARLEPGANGAPADVTFCNCQVHGNREVGLSLSTSTDTLICSSTITGNLGEGIEAVGASIAAGPQRMVITDCTISGNAGDGLIAQNAAGVQVGPGNRVDDNVLTGVLVMSCTGAVIRDNLSIDRNRDRAVWFQQCDDAMVANSPMRNNRVCGIWALLCNRLVIGPGVEIRDTLGTGVELEGSDDCRLIAAQIVNCTSYGVHVVAATNHPGVAPHVLQSCLLADNPALALLITDGPPVICQLCTIAGNFRGVDAGANQLTLDSCIVWGNLLEDVQATATATTVRNSFQLFPPPSGPGNTAADPQFVAPALHDWRLRPSSPAMGWANGALSPTTGSPDAWGGSRLVGALDAGAYEVGPHVVPTDTRLSLASPAMAHGGGGLGFSVQYPPFTAGMLSIVCMQIGPPSGSFPAFGAVIPLEPTPELLLAATDASSFGTLATVPPDGRVRGALLWSGDIPASWHDVPVSLCAIALDGTPQIRAVSNPATFTIR